VAAAPVVSAPTISDEKEAVEEKIPELKAPDMPVEKPPVIPEAQSGEMSGERAKELYEQARRAPIQVKDTTPISLREEEVWEELPPGISQQAPTEISQAPVIPPPDIMEEEDEPPEVTADEQETVRSYVMKHKLPSPTEIAQREKEVSGMTNIESGQSDWQYMTDEEKSEFPQYNPKASKDVQRRAEAIDLRLWEAGDEKEEKEEKIQELPAPDIPIPPPAEIPAPQSGQVAPQRAAELISQAYGSKSDPIQLGMSSRVSRPSGKQKRQNTRMLKAGLDAIRKRRSDLGLDLKKLSKRTKLDIKEIKPETFEQIKTETKVEPKIEAVPFKKKTYPPLPEEKQSEVPDMPMLERKESATSFPVPKKEVPDRPMLERKESAKSFPVVKKERPTLKRKESAASFPVIKKEKQPALQKKETSASFPGPKPKKASPKPKAKKRVRFQDSGKTSTDVKVTSTPTQQVTVTAASPAANLGGLSAKIDELLKESRESKRKGKAKSAYTAAKKQYKAFRKKTLANVKTQNKEIQKRETARIKKLPVKQRAAAKKKLKEALKERTDKVKRQMPSKIQTPGQLRNLMAGIRTLKV
jgi:hypothetical protein